MAEEKDKLQISDMPKGLLVKSTDQVRIRTDRFRSIYANNIQIGVSIWDMSITFGEIIGDKDGKSVIEELAQVKMTREITKILAQLLTTQVRAFEEQTGYTIPLPIISQGDDDSAEDS